jgi:hypothetical protein
MANRTIQQKLLKIKKLKMKKRGQVPMFHKGTGPMKVMYFQEVPRAGLEGVDRKHPDMSMRGRNRAAQGDVFLDAALPGKPALECRSPDELTKLVKQQNPRAIVLAKLIQGDRRQYVIKFVYQSIIEDDILSFRLYMGGGIAFFISVKKLSNGMTRIRKSTEYGQMGNLSGLQRALNAQATSTIQWFTTKDVPTTEDQDTG